MQKWAKQKAFTIVELLIVIVVIGILAAITLIAYNGIQSRAQNAKIQSDIEQIVKAITAARFSESKTLFGITGNAATGASCWGQSDGTNLATLDKTIPGTAGGCWQVYYTTMALISDKSGINVRGLTDPWGRPYLIDENEGEGGTGCGKDTVAVYKLPFTTGFGANSLTPINNVPNSGFSGCTPG